MKHKSLEKWIPLFTLPLTLAVCLALWMIMSNNTYTEVYGENGVRIENGELRMEN